MRYARSDFVGSLGFPLVILTYFAEIRSLFMKIKAYWFLLLFIFFNSDLTFYAQSGKVPQKTESTPIQNPASENTSSRQPGAKFVIDSKSDKYKIIFAPSFDGKYFFVSGEDEYRKK